MRSLTSFLPLSVPGINAQARRLQRIRAKGTPALTSEAAHSSPPTGLRRTVSETSLSPAPTLPEAAQKPEEPLPDTMRYSLYQCPHLLLLQGYSQQHVSHPQSPAPPPLTAQGLGGQASIPPAGSCGNSLRLGGCSGGGRWGPRLLPVSSAQTTSRLYLGSLE